MKIEELPIETRSKFNSLVNAVAQSLNATESPHVSAISQSLIKHDGSTILIMQGGKIRMPGRPPLKYNKSLISNLHRDTLESGNRVLSSIVIKAERQNTESTWELSNKLISSVEYNAITKIRFLVDKEIMTEMLKVGMDEHWERLSFGRDTPNKMPVFVIANKHVQKILPTLKLKELLIKSESIYKDYDLELKVAYWTLRRSEEIEFREYFE